MNFIGAVIVFCVLLVCGAASVDEVEHDDPFADVKQESHQVEDILNEPLLKEPACADTKKTKKCEKLKSKGCCANQKKKCYKQASKKCRATCNMCEVTTTAKPTTEPATDPPTSAGAASACLKAHNIKRALHENTADLVWDDNLAKAAQVWADHLAETGQFQHDNSGDGENLYWSAGGTASTCENAVESWYNEIQYYPFGNPPNSIKDGINEKAIGHFTQVVWKSTRKVGVAGKTVPHEFGEQTYIVARYSPPGNYRGRFADNVGNEICECVLEPGLNL